jgi:hypothetical protein
LVVEFPFFFFRDFRGCSAKKAKNETDADHQGEPEPITKNETNDAPEDDSKDNGDDDAPILGC